MTDPAADRALLVALHRAALDAVEPGGAVARALEQDPDLRVRSGERAVVLALGKAAVPMARAVEEALAPAPGQALVVTKDGHGLPLERFVLRESGHPVPDERSAAAAREVLALARAEPAPELLLVLLSGGASALCTCPLPGLSLADLADTTRILLGSGASIDELNCVRKHLCELFGGRLATAASARRVAGLVVSDVPGDRLDVIASGPLSPDPTTFADALSVLRRRAGEGGFPLAVRRHLERGARGEIRESPKPGAPELARVRQRIVASNRDALEAAAAAGREAGLTVRVRPESLEGEAREVGAGLATEALAAVGELASAGGAELWVLGGETTVTLRGAGRGGRSQELALAAALGLEGSEGISVLAAGTDGTDGPTDAAGAFADGGSAARGRALGLDPRDCLERNDSYRFFAGEGGLLRTGPTRTNVMDLALVLVRPRGG